MEFQSRGQISNDKTLKNCEQVIDKESAHLEAPAVVYNNGFVVKIFDSLA